MKARMKKTKKKSLTAWVCAHPFAMLAAGLTLTLAFFLVQLPRMMNGIDRQNDQLDAAMTEYSEKQEERNVLRTELARADDDLYIETLARREHGYGWYGETIYEVGNLADLQALLEEQETDSD